MSTQGGVLVAEGGGVFNNPAGADAQERGQSGRGGGGGAGGEEEVLAAHTLLLNPVTAQASRVRSGATDGGCTGSRT